MRRCGAGAFLDDVLAPWGQRTSNPRYAVVGECRDALSRCPAGALAGASLRRAQWMETALGSGRGAGIGGSLTSAVSLGGGARSSSSMVDLEEALAGGRLTNGWYEASSGADVAGPSGLNASDSPDAASTGLNWEAQRQLVDPMAGYRRVADLPASRGAGRADLPVLPLVPARGGAPETAGNGSLQGI